MGARETKCPTCKGRVPADPEARTRDFPFCCERCRLVDLGRWLSGEYRVVGEPTIGEPAGGPASDSES